MLSAQEPVQLIDLLSNQTIDAQAIAQVQITPWEQAGSVMSPFALGCAKVSRSLTVKRDGCLILFFEANRHTQRNEQIPPAVNWTQWAFLKKN